MKKFIPCIALIIVLVLASVCALSGCNTKKLVSSADYYECYYSSNSQRYLQSGKSMRFSEDLTSCFTYFADSTYIQATVKMADGINGFSVSYDATMLNQLKKSYTEYLTAQGTMDAADIKTLTDAIVVEEEMYYSEKKVISANAVTYTRSTNFEGALDSLEGVYYSVENDTYIKLFDGYMYSYDATAKTFSTITAKYTINNDIVYFTKTNADGSIYYQENRTVKTAYLYFTVDYPENFEINANFDDTEWNKAIKDDVAKYRGNSVACLATSFYFLDKSII